MPDNDIPLPGKGKPKFFYGYVIVIACFFIMVAMHGTFNTFGVFFTPLEDAFQCSRAMLSGANSVAFIVMGISSIMLGLLSDRFGPRLIMTVSGILFGIGILIMSQVSYIWQVYLVLSLAGIGLSGADIIPLSTVVRWFVRKRGTLSGIMKVGTGLGMMSVPFISSIFIESFGWQKAYLILGITVLVVVIPLAQLLRRDPKEKGLLPDGDIVTPEKPILLNEEGLTLKEAVKTKQLWMVAGFYAVLVYCGMTSLTHIVPYAEGIGISSKAAALIITIYGALSMFGRLAMGFLGDRLGHKRAMITGFFIAIAGMTLLQFAGNLWMLYLFAVVYGFSHGGFFALISPFIAGLFGTRSQGILLGIIVFFGTVGGSIGMTVSGYIYDVTGTYKIAFLIMLGLILTGLVILSLIKPVTSLKTNE